MGGLVVRTRSSVEVNKYLPYCQLQMSNGRSCKIVERRGFESSLLSDTVRVHSYGMVRVQQEHHHCIFYSVELRPTSNCTHWCGGAILIFISTIHTSTSTYRYVYT